MGFPGGKGGLFRQLINLIPDHRVYIETHLGSGAVLRNKRPAQLSYGVERDALTLADWQPDAVPGLNLVNDDATAFLRSYHFAGDEFIYVDPPYVKSARRRPRVYRHELDDQVRIPQQKRQQFQFKGAGRSDSNSPPIPIWFPHLGCVQAGGPGGRCSKAGSGPA